MHLRGRRHPTAQRVFRGAQILPPQQRPRVQQQGRTVTIGCPWLSTRSGHHQRRTGSDHRVDGVTGRGDDGYTGESPTQFLGGAAGTDHHSAHLPGTAAPALHAGVDAPTPPAHRPVGIAIRQRQRAHAVSAARDGAAPAASHRRNITAARHLDQNRCAPFQCGAGGAQGHRRKSCGPRRGVAFLGVPGVVERDDAWRLGADDLPRCHQVMCPAARDQRLSLGGAGVATNECRAP